MTTDGNKEIRKIIKTQMYKQQLNNTVLYYGMLEKKNNSGIMHNDRFVIICVSEYIGYVNQLNNKIELPFKSLEEVPKCKKMIKMDQIKQVIQKSNSIQIKYKEQSKQAQQTWVFRAVNQKDGQNLCQLVKLSQEKKIQKQNQVQKMEKLPQANIQQSKKQNQQQNQMQNNELNQIPKQSNNQPNILPKNDQQYNINNQMAQKNDQQQYNINNQMAPKNDQQYNINNQMAPKNDQQQYNINNQMAPKNDQQQYNINNQMAPKNDQQQYNINNQMAPKNDQQQYNINNQMAPKNDQQQYNINNQMAPKNDQQYNINNQMAANNGQQQYNINNQMAPKNDQQQYNINNQMAANNGQQQYKTINQNAQKNQQFNQKVMQQPIQNNLINQQSIVQPRVKTVQEIFVEQLEKQRLKKQKRMNRQNILPLIPLEWNYRFFKEREEQIIFAFKKHCENLIMQLINQLCLPVKMRTYKYIVSDQKFQIYQIDKLEIKLTFSNLILKNEENVYDQSSLKSVNAEFKNLSYIFNQIHGIQGLQVPLSMIIQYKGIVAFIKAAINQSKNVIQQEKLNQLLQKLSQKTKIQESVYNDKSSLRLVYVDAELYQDFHFAEEQFNLQPQTFQIYYLDEVSNYLPQDLYNIQDFKYKLLRKQFLQKDHQQQKFIGEDFINFVRNDSFKNVVTKREKISFKIPYIIDTLAQEWESKPFFVLNSQQLSSLLHSEGINMRYLGLIYKTTKQPYIKKICMSQICARAIKIILRNNIQELILNYSKENVKNSHQKKNEIIQECEKYVKQMIVDILNTIFVASNQNDLIWNIINKQVKYSFQTDVTKEHIIEGYFLQAISWHCKIIFNWDRFDQDIKIFSKDEYFIIDHIQDFSIESKTYEISHSKIYKQINELLKIESQQNFRKIIEQLDLINYSVPKLFEISDLYNRLFVYLAKFIDFKSTEFQHLKIDEFIASQPLNGSKFTILFNRLKYHIKNNDPDNVIKLFQNIHSRAVKWFGDFNLISGSIYDAISGYFMINEQYQNSLAFAKSSLMNNLNMYNEQNTKIIENYQTIGEIFLKKQQKDQALMYFKKAKIVLQMKETQNSILYGLICLKIAFIFYTMKRYQDAIQSSKISVEILLENNLEEQYQKELTENYEILSESYLELKNYYQYKQLASHCQDIIINVKQPFYFEKILKICLAPKFQLLQTYKSRLVAKICRLIEPDTMHKKYLESLMFFKQQIKDQSFFAKFNHYLENSEKIYETLEQLRILENFQNQTEIDHPYHQFITILRNCLYCLGETFIIYSLNQDL